MPVSRTWPVLSLALIVLSFIYPYLAGGGPENLAADDLRALRFQYYLRNLSLLILWLVAPRGPGLHRVMFLIAGLGLLFSTITFAADGLNRILWGLTALTAVWAAHYRGGNSVQPLAASTGSGRAQVGNTWATHYAGAHSKPPLAAAIPGVNGWTSQVNGFPTPGLPTSVPATPGANLWPGQVNGFPTPGLPTSVPAASGANLWPSQGNAFPPAGALPAVRPPEMVNGQFVSQWSEAAARGLYKKDEDTGDAFSRVCDLLIKINVIVLVIYCVTLVAWTFFGQYGKEEDEAFGLMFSLLSLPFVVGPSILLPGLLNLLLVKAGGGRPIFLAVAATAAATSLLLVLATAADPLLNGPLAYDRFEALAGLEPITARWAGAAALLASLSLLVSRRMEGDGGLEYPASGLAPGLLAALPPVLAALAAAGIIWAGDQSYGRLFASTAYNEPVTTERAGPLEVKLPQGMRLNPPETSFQLEHGRVSLYEFAFDSEEEAVSMFDSIKKSAATAVDDDSRGHFRLVEVVDLPGQEHPTFLHVRWIKRPVMPEGYEFDMPERLEITLWQKQPGGYLGLEQQREFKENLPDEALPGLESETRTAFTAWAAETFFPAYRWTGRDPDRPAGRWVTAHGYFEGDLRPGMTARVGSKDFSFFGRIVWNVPEEGLPFNLFRVQLQPPERPRSMIGRAADHYRGRAGVSRSLQAAGSPGRETLDAGREGCMLQYGCRNIEMNWTSSDPNNPLRVEMVHGGLFGDKQGGEWQLSREVGRWRALLQGIGPAAE